MATPDEPAGDDGARVTQLVVIGASAGGVNALRELLAALPADFPAAIVVAQHQASDHPGRLAELLDRHTPLDVRVAVERQPLEVSVVYVLPANPSVEITDHHIDANAEDGGRYAPSVDRVLATAATAFGDKLTCVVLTGTGADAAAGALAVKAYGGTVIVQNPETAAYAGMPASVPSTAVDIVADLDAIGPLLIDLVTDSYGRSEPRDTDALPAFLDHVRELSGLDFSAYKRPTIERRLQRRMAAVGAGDLAEYRRYLDRTPDEVQRLTASFLIKVTRFFRDPEIYSYLREHILPGLITEAYKRGELRLWSAGCATGEEAYTLAMLVADLLGEDRGSIPVRIFATDVAVDAIDFARHGVYPAAALQDVPRRLIERYFTHRDGTFEVNKLIRSMVVFGEHNLGHRAPFPRIDLILCRNVLIYFTPELQRRSLQIFAFSLRPGGYLALGKAESVSPLPEFFALENGRLKIFRRTAHAAPIPADRILDAASLGPGTRTPHRPAPRLSGAVAPPPATPLAQQVVGMLDQLNVGLVVVDRHYDVRFINLMARRLLGIRDSALGDDLVHRVVPAITTQLKAALDTAFRGETGSATCQLPPDAVDETREIALTCFPARSDDPGTPIDGAIVEVIDTTDASQQRAALANERDRLLDERDALERRAMVAIDEVRELRAVNESMAAEQSRLRADNEHLQLAHEESQAAAEEIETLNEEQQATVEELETLNEELQATVEEVNASNSELEARAIELETLTSRLDIQRRDSEAERNRLDAILTHMSDAVLVLDTKGNIVLTNDAWNRMLMFGDAELSAEDANGRPLPAEDQPVARVVSGEAFTATFTLPGDQGGRRWFEASGQPVQGDGGERWGVMVVRDITDRSLRHLQEEFLATATHELRTPLTVLSGRLQILIRRLKRAETDDALQNLAQEALTQQRRLEARVGELMDMSRLQRGSLTLNRQPVDLRDVARETAEMMEPVTNGTPVAVDTPDEPVMISGDAERLNQVIVNLLTNALKYARESPRIELRVRRDADHAIIEVQDYGPGIPADALPHIFTRFYQRGESLSAADGLGIGLFIVHEIVEAHGGTITPHSIVDEGTTFTIELPVLTDEHAADGAEQGSDHDKSAS